MDDLIRREDALNALTETEEVKGHAYVAMRQALEKIPTAKSENNEHILFNEHTKISN